MQKRKEINQASVAVPPAPVRNNGQRPLTPTVTSAANDKSDNEIPGAVNRSSGICHRANENPGKAQLGDSLMKGLGDQ